jgi:hypothetical protein
MYVRAVCFFSIDIAEPRRWASEREDGRTDGGGRKERSFVVRREREKGGRKAVDDAGHEGQPSAQSQAASCRRACLFRLDRLSLRGKKKQLMNIANSTNIIRLFRSIRD